METKPEETDWKLYIVYRVAVEDSHEYILRRWVVRGEGCDDGGIVLRAPSLDHLRERLPDGLARIDRDPDDDPAIVECWF